MFITIKNRSTRKRNYNDFNVIQESKDNTHDDKNSDDGDGENDNDRIMSNKNSNKRRR